MMKTLKYLENEVKSMSKDILIKRFIPRKFYHTNYIKNYLGED